MRNAPTLATQRLVLRPAAWADVPFLVRLTGDPSVRAYLGGVQPFRARVLQALRTGTGFWIVCTVPGAQRIGLMSLTPHKDGLDTELSYQMVPAQWGQGFATEAAQALVQYGLADLGLPRIIAETQSANARSWGMLQRVGFVELRRLHRFGAEQIILTRS
ncbi:GNAT family N-acetyltransferase [Tateyamaria sp. SN6-1]|uniref:GNAT family N-acetyltransferase n=1 Tax=Tateyamaria sp. SN6-1 TaxID=3092148 RepID=UPI0039F5A954